MTCREPLGGPTGDGEEMQCSWEWGAGGLLLGPGLLEAGRICLWAEVRGTCSLAVKRRAYWTARLAATCGWHSRAQELGAPDKRVASGQAPEGGPKSQPVHWREWWEDLSGEEKAAKKS